MWALLVEDDADVTEVLEHHLERRGFQVCAATCGETAVAMMNQESWDLIMVDILLPNMNGRDLIAHIRSSPSGQVVAIVATSILGRYELQGVDADAHLPKPFRSADVDAVFDKALAASARRSVGCL